MLLYGSGETFAGSHAATAAVASRQKGTLRTSAASDAEPLSESQRCITADKDPSVDDTFSHTIQLLQVLQKRQVYINPNIIQILLQKSEAAATSDLVFSTMIQLVCVHSNLVGVRSVGGLF